MFRQTQCVFASFRRARRKASDFGGRTEKQLGQAGPGHKRGLATCCGWPVRAPPRASPGAGSRSFVYARPPLQSTEEAGDPRLEHSARFGRSCSSSGQHESALARCVGAGALHTCRAEAGASLMSGRRGESKLFTTRVFACQSFRLAVMHATSRLSGEHSRAQGAGWRRKCPILLDAQITCREK